MKWVGFIDAPKPKATSAKTVIIQKVNAGYSTGKISLKWFPEDSIANRVINKVNKEVGMDMVLTMIWENGTFRLDRKSNQIWANWYYDYWLCQLNKQRHKNFIESEDFKDREKHTDYCIWVWKDAVSKWRLYTTFYAYKIRNTYKDRIIYK